MYGPVDGAATIGSVRFRPQERTLPDRPRDRAGILGLIPFSSKDGTFNFSTFNARSEELRDKAAYKSPFDSKRCIVPATGYIEFTGPKGDKLAHLFTRIDDQPIALGGLWERR